MFAFYTDNGSDIQVDEYRRTADAPIAPTSSTRRPVLTIQHDQATHHHGGQLNFGRDGYLYLSTGDGGLRSTPRATPRASARCSARSCASTSRGAVRDDTAAPGCA